MQLAHRAGPARLLPTGHRWGLPSAILAFVCLGLIVFLGYLSTLAPTITWKHWGIDTGELATAAYRLAVPHPSGYPVYVLLGHLFTYLPAGPVAFRLNLMSALFAALTTVMLAWCIYASLGRADVSGRIRLVSALGGGGMLAFSPTFWSQAVLTEVYSLHCFFVTVLLRLLLAWREHALHETSETAARPLRRAGGSGLAAAIGVTFGLGMGNHVTLSLLAPAGLLLLFSTAPVRARNHLWIITVAFLAGLAPYALLMLRAQQGAWPSLWNPDTPLGLMDHIAGGPFRGLLFLFPLDEVLSRLSAVPRLLVQQFGLTGIALLSAGLWGLFHNDRGLLMAGGMAVAVDVLFAVNYPVFDSQVYLLPTYVIAGLGIGWGIGTLAGMLAAARADVQPRNQSAMLRVAGLLPVALALGLPGAQFLANRAAVDLSSDYSAYTQTRDQLEALPPGAILISGSPQEVFSLWYLQYSEGVRPDVIVIDAFSRELGSYRHNLARRFPDVAPPVDAPDYLAAVVAQDAARPVYATELAEPYVDYLPLQPENGMLRVQPADRPS